MRRRQSVCQGLHRIPSHGRDVPVHGKQPHVRVLRSQLELHKCRGKYSGNVNAGKSGTTTNNNDIWFVGFTPYYTAGIWSGCDDNQKISAIGSSTSYHKKIWKAIMTKIHEGLRTPVSRFRPPSQPPRSAGNPESLRSPVSARMIQEETPFTPSTLQRNCSNRGLRPSCTADRVQRVRRTCNGILPCEDYKDLHGDSGRRIRRNG